MPSRYQSKGFTIVELLIVIVVITILVAITITAYNGIQNRATNTARVNHLIAIQKAIELYKADHGHYPPTNPNPGNSGFTLSSDTTFLESVRPYFNNQVIKSSEGTPINGLWYRRFDAGTYGCSSEMGQYYVIMAWDILKGRDTGIIKSGACTGQNLFSLGVAAQDKFTVGFDDYVFYSNAKLDLN